MVMELDRAIGHLIRILYDTKILHDAIVFFTTLTGATQSSNLYTYPSNYPLKGGNGTLWEGGSRALGFVYSNRITKKGMSKMMFSNLVGQKGRNKYTYTHHLNQLIKALVHSAANKGTV